jgi:hypothetical protein
MVSIRAGVLCGPVTLSCRSPAQRDQWSGCNTLGLAEVRRHGPSASLAVVGDAPVKMSDVPCYLSDLHFAVCIART